MDIGTITFWLGMGLLLGLSGLLRRLDIERMNPRSAGIRAVSSGGLSSIADAAEARLRAAATVGGGVRGRRVAGAGTLQGTY